MFLSKTSNKHVMLMKMPVMSTDLEGFQYMGQFKGNDTQEMIHKTPKNLKYVDKVRVDVIVQF